MHNAVCHASIMAQFGSLICIMHQNYVSVLCTMLCIHDDVHHASVWLNAWFNAVHKASVWFIAVYQASIWLNAVQALTYGPMVAQTCVLCISESRCGAWLELCIIHQYGSIQHYLNLPHHTLSTSVFATLFAVNTWSKKKKEEVQNRVLAGCRFAVLTLQAGDIGRLVR